LKLTATDPKPTYIFTDSLNSISFINIQLKHPTTQNNHLDKLLLQEISKHIQTRIFPLHIHKVRAYINILGNEEVDKLTRKGATRKTVPIIEQFQNAHSYPYWLHRAEPYQYGQPFKDPIRNYQKYLDDKELAEQKDMAKAFNT
jgi:hypothetical protein